MLAKFLWGVAFFAAHYITEPDIGWWSFPLAVMGWWLWINVASQLISQDHGN